MKKIIRIITLLSAILTAPLFAGDNRYNENLNMPQDVGGDGAVDYQTGSLSFSVTDVQLPGMNGMHFSATRSYSSTLTNQHSMI